MNRFTLVSDVSGDWEGFYVDGKLVAENHSLAGDELLTLAEVEFDWLTCDVGDAGRLPEQLVDVPVTEDA